MHVPKLRIRVPVGGEAALTRVEIDGEPWPVTRAFFDTRNINGLVIIHLEFHGSVDFESDAPVEIQWPPKALAR